MKEKQCRVKHDLWASTALLREKGGSGAAGTLWGERGLCYSRHIQGLPRTASSVDCYTIFEVTICHLELEVLI